MAFCRNCGNQVPDGAEFCANCGTPVENAQQAPQQPVQPVQPVQQQAGAANFDGSVTGADKGLAWLSYVPWAPAFLVPLFVRKESEYCKFHVKQGATLWAVGVVYQIVKAILLVIINLILPGHYTWYGYYVHSVAYNVFDIALWAGSVFFFVLAIIGIVNAVQCKKYELPLISKIPWIGMLIDKIYAAINK